MHIICASLNLGRWASNQVMSSRYHSAGHIIEKTIARDASASGGQADSWSRWGLQLPFGLAHAEKLQSRRSPFIHSDVGVGPRLGLVKLPNHPTLQLQPSAP
jgi:hypothetical protein